MKTNLQQTPVFSHSPVPVHTPSDQRIQIFPETRSVQVPHWMSWGELHRRLELFGWAPVGGWRANKRVSDFSPAGGINWLQGKYGLSSSQLIAVEVSSGNGKRKRLTPDDAPALFAAIRNGYSGSVHPFSYEFRMAPMREKRMFGCFMFPIQSAMTVLSAFATYVQDAPAELTIMANIGLVPGASPDDEAEPHVMIAACYSGDLAKGEACMEMIRRFGPLTGYIAEPMHYQEILNFFDADYDPANRYHSEFASVPQLSIEKLREILEAVYESPSPHNRISIWYKGGRAGTGSVEGRYLLYSEAQWENLDHSARQIHWTRSMM